MFDIELISGVKNVVANGFYRVCAFPTRGPDQQENSKKKEVVDLSSFLASILDGYKLARLRNLKTNKFCTQLNGRTLWCRNGLWTL